MSEPNGGPSGGPSGANTVGIVANPASGRDIRRLVAGASVFDNAEKGNMVYRLMVGLGTVGVERVLMMPAASGLYDALQRNLRSHGKDRTLPELELVEMTVRHSAEDTVRAVEVMRDRGVAAMVVLGGDGTNRLVARDCADIPLCPLSTGTNNAFPEMREATVAGLALGLLVEGRLPRARVLRRRKLLRLGFNGEPRDCALVDVAASGDRFVGARALWRPGSISELYVAAAAPDAVGLSAVAGLLDPLPHEAPYGLRLQLCLPDDPAAESVVHVPLAPGLVTPVGVAESERLQPGEPLQLEPGVGSVALDGEREVERREGDALTVTLDLEGPFTLDVSEAMRVASEDGLLSGGPG